MINAGSVVAFMELDTSKFTLGLSSAGEQMKQFMDLNDSAEARVQSFNESMTNVGSSAANALTLVLGEVRRTATEISANIDEQISRLQSIDGTIEADFNKLSGLALNFGISINSAGIEASSGMRNLSTEVLKLNGSMQVIPPMLNIVIAKEMDLVNATNGMAAVFNKIISTAGSQVGYITGMISQSAASIRSGITSLQGVMLNILSVLEQILQKLDKLSVGFNSCSVSCQNVCNVIVKSAKSIKSAIAETGKKDIFDEIKEKVETFNTVVEAIEKVIKILKKLGEHLFKDGKDVKTFGSIVGAVFNALPGIISPPVLIAVAIIAALGLIVYEVVKHWDALSKAASDLGKYLDSVFKWWQNAFKSGWNSVIGFLKNINLSHIGKNIIDGLINGIASGAGALVNKMKSVGGKIKDTLKSILGIHSPSTVFASYGVYTGQGYIEGIDKMQSPIQERMATMANGIKNIGKVKPDFKGLDDAVLGSGNAANGSHASTSNLNNNQKHMEFKPTINMYVTVADTGDKGTQQLTTALKDMTTKSLKNTVADMFLKDAFRL
ncbi:hypothetical protein CUB90_03805 [Clostridium sp. CT7]|nr:hypothetical protein CUB90_03805 [Clostridium sp. CT7]